MLFYLCCTVRSVNISAQELEKLPTDRALTRLPECMQRANAFPAYRGFPTAFRHSTGGMSSIGGKPFSQPRIARSSHVVVLLQNPGPRFPPEGPIAAEGRTLRAEKA